MAITHSTAVRDALANLIGGRVNAGTIELANASTFATILAIIPLAGTAFNTSSNGTISAQGLPVEDTAANASGTALFFRVKTSGGVEEWRGSVGLTGSGADLEMPNNVLTVGEPVRISALTYSAPV